MAEVESAHFMEINDLDISPDNSDMIVTGGKDCKVKLWLLSSLMKPDQQSQQCYHEFKDHQSEVTQVKFSPNSSRRLFTGSMDKSVRIWDTC